MTLSLPSFFGSSFKKTLGIKSIGSYGVFSDDLSDIETGSFRCVLVPIMEGQSQIVLETSIHQEAGKSTVSRQVVLKLDGSIASSKSFPVDTKAGMKEYESLRKSLVELSQGGSGRGGRAHPVSVIALCLLGLFIAAILSSKGGSVPSQSVGAGPVSPQAMAALSGAEPQRPVPPDEDPNSRPRLAAEQLALVQKANAADPGGSDKPFYVFSDPMCPSCQQLERNLSTTPQGYRQVVIPVAYKTGAEAIAAAVLCFPAEKRSEAWRRALSSSSPVGPACEAGKKAVKENMEIFQKLGFTETPTMVSPNRGFISGAGTFDQVSYWLKNF